jgi:diguanylate cyclase (GGDEF)-like protein/PAS domain S-box-containing protein
MAIDGAAERASGGLWEPEEIEGRLDALARLWPVATWEYDRGTDRIYWFDSPAEVLNVAIAAAEFLVEPILVTVRHDSPWAGYDLERTLQDLDGNSIDLRVQARRLFAADGTVSGCVGVVTDVSEQRRSEAALRGLVDRYRCLVEVSPDAVVVHRDGIVCYINPVGMRLAGATDVSQVIGRSILEFLHVSSVEETLERIAELSEPGMMTEPAEAVLLRADGTPVAMESISVRIDWEGKPAFQVILRDITERRRAEEAMRYQASLVTQVSDAIVATDLDGCILSWNPAAEALYGSQARKTVGQPVGAVLGAASVGPDGTPRAGEVEHRTADGGSRMVHVSVAAVRNDVGEQTGTVAVCTDLTERLDRRAAEARYRTVVAALDEGVLIVDRDGTIAAVNASATAMIGSGLREGMRVAELMGRWSMIAEDGTALAPEDHPLAVSLRTGQAKSHVVFGISEHGDSRWFSVSVQPLPEADAGGGVVCSFSEITERKRFEKQLSFQATHDPLTSLPNRDLVLQAFADAAARSRRDGSHVAVLLLDLDRFKDVNDTLGHAAGDNVLQTLGARIADVARSGEYLGRLAGDEFVVVCSGLDSPHDAREVGQRIIDVVQEPVRLPSGRELIVTASVGVACVQGGDGTPEVALSHADIAMYRAKALGRARVEVFDETLRSAVARRLLVEEGLRRALDARAVKAHYQTILCAETGNVVGVEALARWEHPTLGQMSPTEFIPIAEETGMMVALGANVLQTACADLARWTRQHKCGSDFMLSVNLSPRQLADPKLVPAVAATLAATDVDAQSLWLEVTESVVMDEEAGFVAAALDNLRALGVHVSIDDFGTGYSSLAYLKRFPVEALKIDRSFVEGLTIDPESDAIVAATVRLAQSLHLRTIAEGVETEQQYQRLRELGCELVQGYLFSHPVPPREVCF